MAIQPPSDIILDVAQAADPTRMQAAAQKLAKMAGANGPSFAQVMDAARTNASAAASGIGGPRQSKPGVVAAADSKTNPYTGLEAAVWQNLVEDMLPKNEGFFGDSAGGDITRTLLAEQLGKQLAKTSTLGIAAQALRQHPQKTAKPLAGVDLGLMPALKSLAAKRG